MSDMKEEFPDDPGEWRRSVEGGGREEAVCCLR